MASWTSDASKRLLNALLQQTFNEFTIFLYSVSGHRVEIDVVIYKKKVEHHFLVGLSTMASLHYLSPCKVLQMFYSWSKSSIREISSKVLIF